MGPEAHDSTDYQGQRTAKAIADAISEAIPNRVNRLQNKQLEGFYKKNNESTKAILFTNKGTTPALWRSLAIDFLGAVDFYVVRDREQDVTKAFGVTSFPQVALLPGGDQAPVVYDGSLARDEIFEFVSGFKKPLAAEKPSPKASKAKSSAKSATTEAKKAAKSATEKVKEATEEAASSSEEPKLTQKGMLRLCFYFTLETATNPPRSLRQPSDNRPKPRVSSYVSGQEGANLRARFYRFVGRSIYQSCHRGLREAPQKGPPNFPGLPN